MKPAAFDYVAPRSVAEAIEGIGRLGPDAKFLAGGQSLVPLMNFRLAQPPALIDLGRIPELRGISVGEDLITIGAMTTHAEIEQSEELARVVPIVRTAARLIGHPAIRNAGTLGGSLAHADPAAEWPVMLTALDASVRADSVRGSRSIEVSKLFMSYFMTTLEPDELLVSIVIPRPSADITWSFKEFARQSGAFGLVLVAVSVARPGGGDVESIRVVLGGCGATPAVVDSASLADLVDLSNTNNWGEAAEAVANQVDSWTSDIHAGADDRRRIAIALLKRSLAEACDGDGDRRAPGMESERGTQ